MSFLKAQNMQQREPYENAQNNLLCFEKMISDLSARIMAAPLDQVDGEIEAALGQILEFFSVDRCGLLEIHETPPFARITHAAFDNGAEKVSNDTDLAVLFPWTFERLLQGEVVNITREEDYPEEAARDRQSHVALGSRSTLNIPLVVVGRIARVIVINHTRRPQVWPEEYIPRLRLLGGIIVNVLERRKDRLRLNEQLRFEMLLSEISAHFVILDNDRVDASIEDAQKRVCECLGLDLSVMWQWTLDTPRVLKLTHLSRPMEDPPPPDPMYAYEYFPWCQELLESGKMVVVSSLDDLPPEAARDKEVWQQFGIKTSLTFPITLGGHQPLGALSFNDMQKERIWSEELIARLQLVAQIFSNVLARKRNETAMRESESRLSMATDAVNAGLWIMDIDTKKVWVSAKSRELFYFSPDEEITYESYFKVIHPDDHGRIRQEVQHALRSGEPLNCDYRLMLPDGGIRWIGVRGQRCLKSSGEPDRVMGISLDITEHKKMEDKLHESQKLLDSLINSTSDLIWSVDPERFGLLTFNRGLYNYFLREVGISIAPGMSPEELLPPYFAQQWHDLYRRSLEQGSFTTEYSAYAGGRTLRLNINTLLHDGKVFGISVFAQDFTSRKKMEEQLSESQTLLTSLINSTSDMIWSVDAERHGILTYNQGLYDRFKNAYNIHLKGGETPDDLLPPEFAQQWHKLYRRALEEGPFITEYKAYAEGRTIRLSLNPLRREDRVYGVSVFSEDITERKLMETQLQERMEEIERLRERLEKENVYLREETKLLFGQNEIVGDSRAINEVLARAGQVALTGSTVLILGETGTGKELIARAIHGMSKRKDRTLVTVNCASLPPNLIESELFGREKGAYTGALTRMVGRFETADGSTLFLDEIGELPFEVQSKLLRVLEEGVFERLGSTKTIRVDVRIIAATNRDLSHDVAEGRFRKDLFYRLNVFPITVPPLRERTEDIPALVWTFVKQFEKTMGKRIESIPKARMDALIRHGWPGNIRELRNVIEHAMILSPGKTLDISLPETSAQAQSGAASLKDMERRHILETLERTNWRISGRNGASELLGMKRTTLQSRIKVLGITRPPTR